MKEATGQSSYTMMEQFGILIEIGAKSIYRGGKRCLKLEEETEQGCEKISEVGGGTGGRTGGRGLVKLMTSEICTDVCLLVLTLTSAISHISCDNLIITGSGIS